MILQMWSYQAPTLRWYQQPIEKEKKHKETSEGDGYKRQ